MSTDTTFMTKFGLLKVGTLFFDPVSGEEFKKINSTQAREELSGEVDDFNSDEEVEL